MTIVHLDAGSEMRGGQWQVLRLMCGLHQRGHKSILLSNKNSALHSLCHEEEGFETGRLGYRSIKRLSGEALVHAHDARSHSIAALAYRGPLVVSRRVIFPIRRGVFSRWKYSRATLFLAVSNAVRDELLSSGIAAQRIRTVYDGVPRLADSWEARGPVVVPWMSDPNKCMILALEACQMSRVPVRCSPNLTQDLVGAGMLVYLSRSEGLGSAALLAMAAGVPVIASDIDGLREVITHERDGLLVHNDAAVVAQAIRRLRDDADLTRRMSLSARQKIQEQFSEDRMVEETIQAYESVARAR